MFEPVTTNPAGILTIITLWCLLTWMLTYYIMSERRRKATAERDDTIEFLNIYCDELHLLIDDYKKAGVVDYDHRPVTYLSHLAQLKSELDADNEPVSYVLTNKGHYVREEN